MSARPSYRSFYVTFWDDPDQHALSDRAYRVLTTLKGTLPMTGIGQVFEDVLAEQCACTEHQLRDALGELERPKTGSDMGWIVRERNIVWIVNGLRFEPNVRSSDTKHKRFVAECFAQFGGAASRLSILAKFREYYSDWFSGPTAASSTGKRTLKMATEDPSEGSGEGSSEGSTEAQDSTRDSTVQDTTTPKAAGAADSSPSPAPAGVVPITSARRPLNYVTRCVVALNAGMQRNLAVAPRFMEIATPTQVGAVLWEQDGIPIETVEEVIASVCAAFRPKSGAGRSQISGLKYFDGAVRQRHEQLATKPEPDRSTWVKGARSAAESEWMIKQGY